MNTAHVVPPLASTKNARRIGVEQGLFRCLVNVVPRYEKHFTIRTVSLLNHRTQMVPCFKGKVFIRIDEYNPIPRHIGECCIACRCEIVLPCPMIYRGSTRLCNVCRIIP